MILTLPTVSFVNSSRRHGITAAYVPEFEVFRKNGDQNSLNQGAAASFTYFLSRKLSARVSDAYQSSKDPSVTMQNVFLLLPRSQFRENAAAASLDFEASPVTLFGIGYANTVTTFGQTDPFQARILDTISSGVYFSATRMVARNQRVRGMYALTKIVPINTAKTNDDAVDATRPFERPMHRVNLEYRVGFNPKTIMEFSGGFITLDTGPSYVFRVTGDRRIGEFWLAGGYARSFSFGAGLATGVPLGLGGPGFYDVVFTRLQGQPTQRVGIEIDATASRDAAGRLAGVSKALLGRGRVDYRWTDRTVTFATVETYQQNVNDFVRAPLSRNRFFVGIEFSLASETGRRTNHLNQDGQYVALTDHARQQNKRD
jgi:hypothetical protein